jgi:hypothetical protein
VESCSHGSENAGTKSKFWWRKNASFGQIISECLYIRDFVNGYAKSVNPDALLSVNKVATWFQDCIHGRWWLIPPINELKSVFCN